MKEGEILNMIAERNAARKSKDFKKADDIRFVSPYAMMLKMEDIRKQSIKELKD